MRYKIVADKNKQRKLQDLLILLTSTFISDEELNKIWEANMRILEDSPAVRVLGNWFRSQREIEIAINLLRRGRNIQEVAEDTGLDVSRVEELQVELQTELQAQAV